MPKLKYQNYFFLFLLFVFNTTKADIIQSNKRKVSTTVVENVKRENEKNNYTLLIRTQSKKLLYTLIKKKKEKYVAENTRMNNILRYCNLLFGISKF